MPLLHGILTIQIIIVNCIQWIAQEVYDVKNIDPQKDIVYYKIGEMSMTEEQIKQNAEEYAINSGYEPLPKCGWIDCTTTDTYGISVDSYIAGAHSRDEEIEELQKENLYMESLLSMHRKMTGECELKLQKLRNPWISVEKHPDDVTKDYLLEYEDGSHIVAIWDSGMWMSKNLHPLKEPIRWMSIPQTEKGEKN